MKVNHFDYEIENDEVNVKVNGKVIHKYHVYLTNDKGPVVPLSCLLAIEQLIQAGFSFDGITSRDDFWGSQIS